MNSTSYSKLWLSLSFLLAFTGLMYFFTMPRQEDPGLQDRFGQFVYIYPGASAEQVEKLVAKPLEDELSEVEQIKDVKTTVRSQAAIIEIDLQDSTRDFSQAWIDIDEAVVRSERQFPDGVYLSEKIKGLELEAIVLSLNGPPNLLDTLDSARALRELLLKNSDVAKVKIIGDPQEQMSVEINDDQLANYGIRLSTVISILQNSNSALSTGTLQTGERRLELRPATNFNSPDDIRALKIPLSSGSTLALGQIAEVKRQPKYPISREFRTGGQAAIGLGIIPRENINVVLFGNKVREIVRSFQTQNLNLKIQEVAFQPYRTEKRLDELLRSLVIGILSVIALLGYWLGWRTSLVVGLSVPAITLIGLALYGIGGGILQQISIAAFVVSIGQFIDNIIVIVDGTQKKIQNGMAVSEAAQSTSNEFKRPMIFATGTGIAAFIPMLAAQGPTADFTIAFPVVAILTLIVSYFFAIYSTPALMQLFYRSNSKSRSIPGMIFFQSGAIRLATGPAYLVVSISIVALFLSAVGFVFVKKQFFPAADRNEFLFSLQLPESSDFSKTKKVTEEVEKIALQNSRVQSVVSTIGGGMPRFYYNLPNLFESPHVAQLLITTKSYEDNLIVGQALETYIAENAPQVMGYARYLEQGPPVAAPIELRLYSDEPNTAYSAISETKKVLSQIDGTRAIRDSLGHGSAFYQVLPFDDNFSQLGYDRTQLSLSILKQTQGITVGTYRGGDELMPLVIRNPTYSIGENGSSKNSTADQILDTPAIQSKDKEFRLTQLATLEIGFAPSLLSRRNKEPYYSVLADLQPGYTFSQITQQLNTRISALQNRHPGVRFEYGGDSEGAGEANSSILRVVPLALIVLVICLLAEFRSFRKLGIVLVSLPFVLTGIAPGLLIGQAAFGFMSLLGLLALMGIVVNNVILILESLSDGYEKNLDAEQTIRQAIESRLRPILLTSLLTLVGLLPLALENSSLWPPLAWSMISGLIASVFSTIVVVPTLFRVLYYSKKIQSPLIPLMVVFLLTAFVIPSQKVFANESEIEILMEQAEKSLGTQAADLDHESQRQLMQKHNRSAFLPELNLQYSVVERNHELQTQTLFGLSKAENKNYHEAQIEIIQPVFHLKSMYYGRQSLKSSVNSSELLQTEARYLARLQIGESAYRLMQSKSVESVLQRYIQLLKQQKLEVQRQIFMGRLSRGDLARIDIEISKLENHLTAQLNSQNVFLSQLRRFQIEPKVAYVSTPRLSHQHRIRQIQIHSQHRIQALKAQESALDWQARGVHASLWPQLIAFGRVRETERVDLIEKRWSEIGLSLHWNLFEGGRSQSEKRALLAQKEALNKRIKDHELQLESDLSAHYAELNTRLDRRRTADLNLNLAREAVLSERNRFKNGRGSLQELLTAEALLNEITLESVQIPFQLAQICLRIQHAAGLKPQADCREVLE